MAVPDKEITGRMRRFAQTCRDGGLKVTHQRTEVFREVAGADEHPDAETIFQRVRRRVTGISLDTVYRTLPAMEALGLVRRTEISGQSARYDANTDMHHHFVCTRCGRVDDFYSEALDGLAIPRSVQALGRIESAQVQVRGVCSACEGRRGGKARKR